MAEVDVDEQRTENEREASSRAFEDHVSRATARLGAVPEDLDFGEILRRLGEEMVDAVVKFAEGKTSSGTYLKFSPRKTVAPQIFRVKDAGVAARREKTELKTKAGGETVIYNKNPPPTFKEFADVFVEGIRTLCAKPDAGSVTMAKVLRQCTDTMGPEYKITDGAKQEFARKGFTEKLWCVTSYYGTIYTKAAQITKTSLEGDRFYLPAHPSPADS